MPTPIKDVSSSSAAHRYAGLAACSADEWLAGATKTPLKASLDPAKAGSAPVSGGAAKAFTVKKNATQLQKELDAAMARIGLLEGRLKKAGLDVS